MDDVLDIFAKLPDGSPLWIESINGGLPEARKRIRELNRIFPRDYFIYYEHNGMIQREEHSVVR